MPVMYARDITKAGARGGPDGTQQGTGRKQQAGLELTFLTQFLFEADGRILLDDAAGFWV
jgi:hypothetical protein